MLRFGRAPIRDAHRRPPFFRIRMDTVVCPTCTTASAIDHASCPRCGEPLAGARLEQAVARTRALLERAGRTSRARRFSTVQGIGTMLLDYRPRGDGTYTVVRWFTVSGVPLVPLGGYVVDPVRQDHSHGAFTTWAIVLERTPFPLLRVLHTYLLLAIGVGPLVLGSLNASWVNRTLGGERAFFAMLACGAWAFYVVFFRIWDDRGVFPKERAHG